MKRQAIFKFSTIIILPYILILLLSTSCEEPQESYTWSEADKEMAREEIHTIARQVIDNAARINFEQAAEPYWNSTDFFIVNPDGTFDTYGEFISKGKEMFDQLTSYEQATNDEQFRFLNKDQVLYTWIGKANVTMKSGEKMQYASYVGTMLFRKIDGNWKITYAHESASTPEIQMDQDTINAE